MSLTSFVRQPEVRKAILERVPLPSFDPPETSPIPRKTNNAVLVGTAFDYLMRTHLAKVYPWAEEDSWVAEFAADPQRLYSATVGDRPWSTAQKSPQWKRFPTIAGLAAQSIVEATQERRRHLRSGAMLQASDETVRVRFRKELMEAYLRLAALDRVYRDGRLDPDFRKVDPRDVDDLQELFRRLPERYFGMFGVNGGANTPTIDKRIMLNPTFSKGSALVGGADGDVILGDILIEIKVVSDFRRVNEHWAQLVGYAILSQLAREADGGFPRLTEFSVYFARHRWIWSTPAKSIYGAREFPALKKWFIREARKQFR